MLTIPCRLPALRLGERYRRIQLRTSERLAWGGRRTLPVVVFVLRSFNLNGLIPALILAYGCTLLLDPRAFWFVLGAVMTGDYLLSELRTLRPPRS